MSTEAKQTHELTGRELRWLADHYEQNQRMRIETGERIRAVVQGRDETFVPMGDILEPEEAAERFGGERPEEREWTELDEPVWLSPDGHTMTADEALNAIRRGDTRGPVPMLGRSYHRYAAEERETKRDMDRALEEHPAWQAWLVDVRGIGPTLACKLLARLDPRKAPHASSYWKYCGLATVPGIRYECGVCRLRRGFPVRYNVSGDHEALCDRPAALRGELPDGRTMTLELESHDEDGLDAAVSTFMDEVDPDLVPSDPDDLLAELDELIASAVALLADGGSSPEQLGTVGEVVFRMRPPAKSGKRCPGTLEQVAGPDDGVRVAQPKPKKGEQAGYDQYAKKICYLVGTSFLKVGGPYEEYYRRERAKAESEKPGWTDGRKHHKALRKTEKLFLAHLWRVHREELGLPTGDPYPVAELDHDPESIIKPEDMTGDQSLPAR